MLWRECNVSHSKMTNIPKKKWSTWPAGGLIVGFIITDRSWSEFHWYLLSIDALINFWYYWNLIHRLSELTFNIKLWKSFNCRSVSPRGAGWLFGSYVTELFMNYNDLNLICRAHQLVNDGKCFIYHNYVNVNIRLM